MYVIFLVYVISVLGRMSFFDSCAITPYSYIHRLVLGAMALRLASPCDLSLNLSLKAVVRIRLTFSIQFCLFDVPLLCSFLSIHSSKASF